MTLDDLKIPYDYISTQAIAKIDDLNAKYDVMAGSRQNFIENRVAPLCSRLEAAEEVTVKSIDPAATGWFDIDSLPIMQTARRTRLTTAKTGFDMGIPFNELNRVTYITWFLQQAGYGDERVECYKMAEYAVEAALVPRAPTAWFVA